MLLSPRDNTYEQERKFKSLLQISGKVSQNYLRTPMDRLQQMSPQQVRSNSNYKNPIKLDIKTSHDIVRRIIFRNKQGTQVNQSMNLGKSSPQSPRISQISPRAEPNNNKEKLSNLYKSIYKNRRNMRVSQTNNLNKTSIEIQHGVRSNSAIKTPSKKNFNPLATLSLLPFNEKQPQQQISYQQQRNSHSPNRKISPNKKPLHIKDRLEQRKNNKFDIPVLDFKAMNNKAKKMDSELNVKTNDSGSDDDELLPTNRKQNIISTSRKNMKPSPLRAHEIKVAQTNINRSIDLGYDNYTQKSPRQQQQQHQLYKNKPKNAYMRQQAQHKKFNCSGKPIVLQNPTDYAAKIGNIMHSSQRYEQENSSQAKLQHIDRLTMESQRKYLQQSLDLKDGTCGVGQLSGGVTPSQPFPKVFLTKEYQKKLADDRQKRQNFATDFYQNPCQRNFEWKVVGRPKKERVAKNQSPPPLTSIRRALHESYYEENDRRNTNDSHLLNTEGSILNTTYVRTKPSHVLTESFDLDRQQQQNSLGRPLLKQELLKSVQEKVSSSIHSTIKTPRKKETLSPRQTSLTPMKQSKEQSNKSSIKGKLVKDSPKVVRRQYNRFVSNVKKFKEHAKAVELEQFNPNLETEQNEENFTLSSLERSIDEAYDGKARSTEKKFKMLVKKDQMSPMLDSIRKEMNEKIQLREDEYKKQLSNTENVQIEVNGISKLVSPRQQHH